MRSARERDLTGEPDLADGPAACSRSISKTMPAPGVARVRRRFTRAPELRVCDATEVSAVIVASAA
jgi:hypothetical protein